MSGMTSSSTRRQRVADHLAKTPRWRLWLSGVWPIGVSALFLLGNIEYGNELWSVIWAVLLAASLLAMVLSLIWKAKLERACGSNLNHH
jgi:hypothetical protein